MRPEAFDAAGDGLREAVQGFVPRGTLAHTSGSGQELRDNHAVFVWLNHHLVAHHVLLPQCHRPLTWGNRRHDIR
jgi:hypothetical protein